MSLITHAPFSKWRWVFGEKKREVPFERGIEELMTMQLSARDRKIVLRPIGQSRDSSFGFDLSQRRGDGGVID